MKDFLDNDIQVGDKVAAIELGYKNLIKATVVKLTAKMIIVEFTRKAYPNRTVTEQTKRFSDQVIKI